jgi:hypothetical protein
MKRARRVEVICYPRLLPKGSVAASALLSGNTKPPDFRGLCVKRMKGFEPSTFAMARRRSSQLSYIRATSAF